jgi:hypothetical protein
MSELPTISHPEIKNQHSFFFILLKAIFEVNAKSL